MTLIVQRPVRFIEPAAFDFVFVFAFDLRHFGSRS